MAANQPSGRQAFEARSSAGPFWSAQAAGAVTTLTFYPDAILAGVNPHHMSGLWRFFEDLFAGTRPMLLVSIPRDGLSHRELVLFREHVAGLAAQGTTLSAQDYRDRAGIEITHQDIALRRYLAYLCDSRLFSVGCIQGEIDIHLLGLFLACDYRLATPDTTIVQRGRPLGSGFGTATPWFLARLLGRGPTMDILLRESPISSTQACKLGIFHRLVPARELVAESLRTAQAMAAPGATHLLTLKQALDAAHLPLQEYLDIQGSGFHKMPLAVPFCQGCGYNLTGNTSGRCPECGLAME